MRDGIILQAADLAVTTPPLWKHQADAVEFCTDRKGSLLHMGLGTGKTRVAVQLLEDWGAKSAIAICPLSVIQTWVEQVEEFSRRDWIIVTLGGRGSGTVAKKTKRAKAEMQRAHQTGRPILLVLNFEAVYREPFGSWAIRQGFDVLICDESHRLKAHKGVQSRYASRLAKSIPRHLLLTGTPMPSGSPVDVFAQFRILDPSIFGESYFRWRNRYCVMGGFGGHEIVGHKNEEDLKRKLASVTFQVGREVLDLPEATHTRRMVELGPEAAAVYAAVERGMRVQIASGEINPSNALVKLLRLMQISGGHAATDDGGEVIDTAKEDELCNLFQEMGPDEPVVVFAQFKHDLAAIHRAAARAGRQSAELSGSRRELEEWKRPDGPPVLAAQIHSGGVGVSLVRARFTVYYSTGYNLGDFIQSLARCHRPGQEHPVGFYHLIAAGTIDEKVSEALRKKQSVVDAILDHLKPQEA